MTARIGAALAAGLGGLAAASTALAQCAPGGCSAYTPASPAYAVTPPPAYAGYGSAPAAPGYGAANRYGEGYGYAAGPCSPCAPVRRR